MNSIKIPTWLSHKPIVALDYRKEDALAGAKDALFLSIGRATWNNKSDFSAKIFRRVHGRWSRQSEELPLWRVIDIATLVVSVINGNQSGLGERTIDEKDLEVLQKFIENNKELYSKKIERLNNAINRK